ncbi:UvrD-like Helicase, ATP-binding domain, P-loop containing nucleoside triphosphate hydrolase [Quillaja saponaria]|uniref:UvrD-like Helicase, ATP-binding domain, P-loop containing nucleoside triphosphate hydrolase n=1 Tax=Quillaja saponaria TaxID=32244 RepID=A0AAD7KNH7_QUISA|nr:UvrD-like Helicase, ATP-binding domain, P-loop containing nucleoside triphosphate hydrolase [Quillaja saponaria]
MSDVKPSLRNINDFIGRVINDLLFNKEETKEWIRKSNTNVKDYYPLLVLRLICMLCLLHLNSGECVDSLINILRTSSIVEQLPQAFYGVLRKSKKQNVLANLNVFAEAFEKIDDPLVIVRLWNNSLEISCPNAFLVDLMVYRHKEDVVKMMFPKKVESVIGEAASVEEATNSSEVFSSSVSSLQDSNFTAVAGHALNIKLNNKVSLPLGYNHVLELFETLLLTENEKDRDTLLSNAQKMKDSVKKGIQFLTAAGTEPLHVKPSNKILFGEVVDELEQLSAALDGSEPELVKNISVIGELSRRVLSRPKLEHILSQLFLPHNTNFVAGELNTIRASGNQSENDNDYNYKASEEKKADKNLKASEATITSGAETSIPETLSKGKKNNKPKKHKGGKRSMKW